MPFPTITFNTLDEWKTWVDNNILPNANEEINGNDGNITENAAVKFIKQSPLNWEKAIVVSSGGDVTASRPVVVFTTVTPDSLTWNDNIYNEYLFVNMTANAIDLAGLLVYYTPFGTVADNIPANSVVSVFKAANDLWVQGNNTASGGTGNSQKQPQTYVVGTTPNAPAAGTNTWTLPAFLNSWVVLILGRSIYIDMTDAGDGGMYITKSLASDTLTINNYTWNTGDILSYILITP